MKEMIEAVLEKHVFAYHKQSNSAACLGCPDLVVRAYDLPGLLVRQAEHQTELLTSMFEISPKNPRPPGEKNEG